MSPEPGPVCGQTQEDGYALYDRQDQQECQFDPVGSVPRPHHDFFPTRYTSGQKAAGDVPSSRRFVAHPRSRKFQPGFYHAPGTKALSHTRRNACESQETHTPPGAVSQFPVSSLQFPFSIFHSHTSHSINNAVHKANAEYGSNCTVGTTGDCYALCHNPD